MFDSLDYYLSGYYYWLRSGWRAWARDLAAAVRQAWQAQGYSYPLLVTDLSTETLQRAGIDPSAVTSNQ